MIKNPFFFFAYLMLGATLVIFIFQLKKQHTNPNQDFAWQQITTLYQQQCALCHGTAGEGVGTSPALHGRHLPLDNIKEVIQKGSGDMPPFPAIKEPLLSTLANYVHQL